ncbi:Bypass of stop codon protein 6 [Tolypocladium paradoxum]|uniref:Bypass of stop codon protein 6 n=1 Tax=Tolypocladium paradoxum TaxID=94208 RepID=A0A2S4KYS4_9HYPO|nr:Bypass of stop codon protein 6 [Tolypocladium paradoxum]
MIGKPLPATSFIDPHFLPADCGRSHTYTPAVDSGLINWRAGNRRRDADAVALGVLGVRTGVEPGGAGARGAAGELPLARHGDGAEAAHRALGAIFIFAYQGAEVSISDWVISFLINARGGDPSSVGYISAGFWAGITLGRFCLSGPAQRIGENVFWVPNIVGNAVAMPIVGPLLGPVYPCGNLGGAVAPFITGLLAQAVGTYVLHPIVIALFAVMLLCWYGIPVEMKRTE